MDDTTAAAETHNPGSDSIRWARPGIRGALGDDGASLGHQSHMGELFALLYITGRDWTADELRRGCGSRGVT